MDEELKLELFTNIIKGEVSKLIIDINNIDDEYKEFKNKIIINLKNER